jgi:hypothetical protein
VNLMARTLQIQVFKMITFVWRISLENDCMFAGAGTLLEPSAAEPALRSRGRGRGSRRGRGESRGRGGGSGKNKAASHVRMRGTAMSASSGRPIRQPSRFRD